MKKPTNDIREGLLEPSSIPAASELKAMLSDALGEGARMGIYEKFEQAHNTRKAFWEGQSSDGRKWPECYQDLPDKNFPGPFPGASDARIRSADEVIRECVLVQMAALRKGELLIGPANGDENDVAKSSQWRGVLAYYTGLMEGDILREGEILSNLMNEFGYAVVKTWWHRRHRLVPKTISVQDVVTTAVDIAIQQALAQLPNGEQDMTPELEQQVQDSAVTEFTDMLTNPDRKAELVQLIIASRDDLTEAEALRVAPQLKKGLTADYFGVVLAEERPKIKVMIPWVNIFFPVSGPADFNEMPWAAEVEWYTPLGLEQVAAEDGLDEEFIRQVKEKGKGMAFTVENAPTWLLSGVDISMALAVDQVANAMGQSSSNYQLVTLWHQGMSKSGVSAWYRTVFHPAADVIGLHECSPYDHLGNPYVGASREFVSPLFAAARGIGELAATNQSEMKTQVDTRTDNSALKTNPPLEVPPLMSGGNIDIRPGRQIPTRRVGGIGGITPIVWPSDVGSSVEIENAARNRMDGYFFRGGNVDPDIKRLAWTDLAARYLQVWKQITVKTWSMIQQFTSDINATQIAGSPVSVKATKKDLEGDPDITFNFDAGDLSLEFMEKKLTWIAKLLLPMDADGSIDRHELVRLGFQSLDPAMARRLVRDQGAVSQAEVNDEMMAISMTVTGLEAPLKEQGINPALRLQVIQDAVAKSPRLQQILQADEQVRAVLERRVQTYQFQLDQAENANIGRGRTQPALDTMAKQDPLTPAA